MGVLHICYMFLVLELIGVTVVSIPFPQHMVEQIVGRLRDKYGENEVKYFNKMLSTLRIETNHNLDDDDEKVLKNTLTKYLGSNYVSQLARLLNEKSQNPENMLMKAAIFLVKDEFRKLRNLEKSVVLPNSEHFQEIRALAKDLSIVGAVPCTTPSSCKKLEVLMNRCTYARNGAMFAYNIFLVVTHVLNTMIAVLCACIFVGPVHLCALRNFPYTCVFPYPVFQSMFMATSAVWESVKATSTICRIYGDPGVSSVLA